MIEKNKKRKNRKDSAKEDLMWIEKDTLRRQGRAVIERRERNRRLSERDAAFAKEFPNLVRHGKLAHEVVNDEFADLRRRFVG